MRSITRFAVHFLFTLTIIGLVIAQFGGSISPSKWAYSQLVGLTYPYFLFATLGFSVYFILRKKRTALIGLLAIAIGWPNPVHLIQFSSSQEIQEGDIKLLSYNIRLFNKYGWKPDKTVSDQLLDFIEKEQADILCLQEFYHIETEPSFKSLLYVKERADVNHYYFEQYKKTDIKRQRFFGLVTYSKYPIINYGTPIQPNFGKAAAIFTDLLINKDTIRVYNIHLKSLGFKKSEYELIAGKEEGNTEEQINRGKGILKKLVDASIARSNQAVILKSHIDQSPYPVIIAGDFNETPFTFAYQTLGHNLQDGFRSKGNGMGYTYGLSNGVPPLKIDHILADDSFEFIDFTNQYINLSDHEPISATLRLSQGN
jgi:endonuclease/exonuclease/phosphatase family metal-dependent hydrolase